MRAYFFTNMYISPIQHGIQAKHVGDEMVLKYFPIPTMDDVGHEQCWQPSPQAGMLGDWMQNHKTVILLNGGFGEALRDLVKFFEKGTHAYPFAEFHESKEALDGALTGVGIILPEEIYNGAGAMRKVKRLRRDDSARVDFEYNRVLLIDLVDGTRKTVEYTTFEVELMERLNSFRLV